MKMPFTLDAPSKPLGVLAENGDTANREAMLAEFKAGQRHSVQFVATTYVHGPNKNHTRLNDAELERFAASFKGQPFLMDHKREQGSRGGTIIDSQLIDVDGGRAIRQTIKAVKPWAVEGVLDGTVDRFSIGFDSQEYLCSVHGTAFFKCGHGLEHLGELDEKSGNQVEVVLKGIEGTETSAVTHPAVSGTGVLDALQSLQSLSETASREALIREKDMKERIYSLLSLSAETPEKEALAKLEQRLSVPVEKVPVAMLKVLELPETTGNDEAIAAVVSMKVNSVPATEHTKALDRLATIEAERKVEVALAERRITPAGKAWAVGFAKSNPEGFDAYLKHAPVGGPPVEPVVPTPAKIEEKPEQMSELAAHVAGQMGVTEEEYRKVLASESVN